MPFINLDLKHVFQQFFFTEVLHHYVWLIQSQDSVSLLLTFQFNNIEPFTQLAPMMTAVVILIKAR